MRPAGATVSNHIVSSGYWFALDRVRRKSIGKPELENILMQITSSIDLVNQLLLSNMVMIVVGL